MPLRRPRHLFEVEAALLRPHDACLLVNEYGLRLWHRACEVKVICAIVILSRLPLKPE